MHVEGIIKVTYKSTSDPKIASRWLETLGPEFAADFETAIRYTKEEVQQAKERMLDTTLPKRERIVYQTIANATALGHPSHCTITHCSMACSESEAYVFIIDKQEMADVILDFLVDTTKTQIWHNYSYDGRFIKYFTGKQPKTVEDTQVFAKTLINHVDILKARSSLKLLAGEWYGDWGISSDNFIVEQQYDEHVLHYAAIDACATYKLWRYLNDFVQSS